MHTVTVALAYSLFAGGLVLATGWELSRHGSVLLRSAFPSDPEKVAAMRSLLLFAFYLFNVGWICVSLDLTSINYSLAATAEEFADRVGIMLMVLALTHFSCALLYSRMRRRGC